MGKGRVRNYAVRRANSRGNTDPFQGGDNILVLGDSFTEALQVPNDQKFVSVAEIILRQGWLQF